MSRIPTSPSASPLNKTIKRRRILPAASAAAAAVSLAGCGMLGARPATYNPPPPSSDQQAAARRVQAFTSDIDQALDNVDKQRLEAAAQKATQPPSSSATEPATASTSPPAAANAVTPATAPAAESPAAASAPVTAAPRAGQSPVILASAVPSPTETPVSVRSAVPSAPHESVAAPAPSPSAAAPSQKDPVAAAQPMPPSAPAAGNSVITPMAPVAAAPASAMSSMTAMLTNPQPAVQAVTAAAASPSASASPVADAAQPTLQQALAVIRQNVGEHPTLATSLALALLDNQPPKDAPDPSAGLSEMDRKIFSDLLAAIDTIKTQSASAAATLAQRAAPLLDASKKWQADADLQLPRLVLASRVDSFGVYTPIDSKFEQGHQHTVIIYCEVANFSSKKSDDGWFTTDLQQQETLITDDGLLIWRPNPEDIEDRSMNQRHDFYMVKKLTIPDNLAAGKYTLRMSVTDKNANKRSLVSLPIEITAAK